MFDRLTVRRGVGSDDVPKPVACSGGAPAVSMGCCRRCGLFPVINPWIRLIADSGSIPLFINGLYKPVANTLRKAECVELLGQHAASEGHLTESHNLQLCRAPWVAEGAPHEAPNA